MATRAHSTPAPASRTRPHKAVAAALPKASSPRRLDAEELKLPGAAALLQRLEILWQGHTALEAESRRLRGEGQLHRADALAASASYRAAQAAAMERLALAFPPSTPTDAIAQLILAHAEISSLTSSDGDCEEAVRVLLETATLAVAVLAKVDGFDLTALSFQYLTQRERMIVRGDVLT